jgi:hypothetical protein
MYNIYMLIAVVRTKKIPVRHQMCNQGPLRLNLGSEENLGGFLIT